MNSSKNQIVIYKSPVKSILVVLAGLLFFALAFVGFDTSTYHENSLFTWIRFVPPVALVIIGLYHLLDKNPQLIIDKTGITSRALNNKIIHWKNISNANFSYRKGLYFISLATDDTVDPELRWRGDQHHSRGAQDVSIPISILKVNKHNLMSLITDMIVAYSDDDKEAVIAKYSNVF
jgi:hypothetical protein